MALMHLPMKSEAEIRAKAESLKGKEAQVQIRIDAKNKEGKDEIGTKLLVRTKMLLTKERETLEWALNERV